jgi:hypothetical protein
MLTDPYAWFSGLAGPYFMNVGSLLAGILLISSPIIIHLINRMRYKRVRWAAMEFLLKAQKRMKRKMIIEQLILLLLRILLMLLIGILIARFYGFDSSSTESRSTHHVVLIDDSPSMADAFRAEDGTAMTSLQVAKNVLLDQIAPAAAQSTTPQSMDVLVMSDLENPRKIDRLNPTTIEEVRSSLGTYGISTVRVDLPTALLKAEERINAAGAGDTAKILHVLTDLRSTDWIENGPAIKLAIEKLSKNGVKVHFIDTANPYRKAAAKTPLYNDNIGILDFKPAKTVAARGEPVEFMLKVKNFGSSELKDVRFSVRINGVDTKAYSFRFATLPPGEEVIQRTEVTLDRAFSPDNIFEGRAVNAKVSEDEKATFKKVFDRFNLVTAVLESDEPGGIVADNVRHTLVELREKLPILVIDGDPSTRDKQEGNSLFLQKHFENPLIGGGYRWMPGKIENLATDDLGKYSIILICNVPTIPEAGAKALEAYCQNGGGVGFFMGDAVKPQDYNKILHREGAGLFPVPLPDKPSEDLTEEQIFVRRLNISQKKFLMRDMQAQYHPALAPIYLDNRGQPAKDIDEVEKFYRFVLVQKYWPVKRIGKWREDRNIAELYCLPNDSSPGQYDKQVEEIANSLPVDDTDFAKFKEILSKYQKELKQAARVSTSLTDTVGIFDKLLSDQRTEADAEEALLREFWSQPKNADLKSSFARLRDLLKYGDPLYLARSYGRGRVTVFLSNLSRTADSKGDWCNWAWSPPGNASFTPVMKELGNYLSGGGGDEGRTCGATLEFQFPAENYDPKVYTAMVTHDGAKPRDAAPGVAVDPAPMKLADQFDPLEVKDGMLYLKYTNTAKPGVYIFGFEQKRPNPTNPTERISVPEYRIVPVNIDTAREGDLRRASSDDVIANAVGSEIHSPDDKSWIDKLKNKKTDLSELGWIFMIFFVVLLLEQAMAVRLSYHANPETLASQAPSAAAAMRPGMAHAAPATEET